MRALLLAIMGCATLAACGGGTGSDGPDEFAVLPVEPLRMPDSLNVLPAPTPGGPNLADPEPRADAVAALGGSPAAVR